RRRFLRVNGGSERADSQRAHQERGQTKSGGAHWISSLFFWTSGMFRTRSGASITSTVRRSTLAKSVAGVEIFAEALLALNELGGAALHAAVGLGQRAVHARIERVLGDRGAQQIDGAGGIA